MAYSSFAQKPVRQVHDPEASPKRPHDPGNAPRDSAERGIRQSSCRAIGDQSQDGRQMERPAHDRGLSEGAKQPVSSVLTPAEEALIVIFRKRMLFTIDDCFLVLKKGDPPSQPFRTSPMLEALWCKPHSRWQHGKAGPRRGFRPLHGGALCPARRDGREIPFVCDQPFQRVLF